MKLLLFFLGLNAARTTETRALDVNALATWMIEHPSIESDSTSESSLSADMSTGSVQQPSTGTDLRYFDRVLSRLYYASYHALTILAVVIL